MGATLMLQKRQCLKHMIHNGQRDVDVLDTLVSIKLDNFLVVGIQFYLPIVLWMSGREPSA